MPFPIDLPRGAGGAAHLAHVQPATGWSRPSPTCGSPTCAPGSQPDLPELDLTELSGRIGWKQSDTGFEVTTSRLGLTTTGGPDAPAGGFPAALQRRPARARQRAASCRRTRSISRRSSALADHLPLGPEARKQLAEYSPKGSLHDVVVRWTGDWREPRQYSVRGRFQGLSLNRAGKIPGFTGVSGAVEANERGGTLSLQLAEGHRGHAARVPRRRSSSTRSSAQVSWARSGGETELRLNNISFSNPHLAGTVFGSLPHGGRDARRHRSYRQPDAGRRALRRAATSRWWSGKTRARLARRRVPRGPVERRDAAPQGQSRRIPVSRRQGRRVPGDGQGHRMARCRLRETAGRRSRTSPAISCSAASAWRCTRARAPFSAHASRNVHAEIPDLLQPEKVVLNVTGEAEGPTGDFLAFIEKSPVTGMIDHFTDGWQAQGTGKLALKLAIPLRRHREEHRSRAPTSSPTIRSRSPRAARSSSRRAAGSSSPKRRCARRP